MTDDSENQRLHNGNGTYTKPFIVAKNCIPLPSRKPLGERKLAVRRQELMVFLGNMGVLGAGMAVALPSVTLGQLSDQKEEFHLNPEEASWFSSINSMACPLGGLLVSTFMDRIGRKYTILLTNIIGVLGWALLAAAPLQGDREAIFKQILFARFLSGIAIGLCVSPVGVYSAEISLPKIRGRLILGTSIGIAGGILFMYVLGYFIRGNWQLIAFISCIYQIISAICVFPMPESPSWLMQKGNVEKARKSLEYFRGLNRNESALSEEFETELAQIHKTATLSRETSANESLLQAIKAPEVYKPLVLMIGFFGFQQFSGVVVVVVFAVQIAQRAGVSSDPLFVAVMVGVARMTTIFFMSSIFEKWGRKPAGLISATGMSVCMLLLAIGGWYPAMTQALPILPAICIVMHIVFSTMGLLTLPFFMISEVFPQRVRGGASGLTVSVGLLISFVVIKLFPDMERVMGTANVFAFYGCVSLLGVAYIFFLIPETRGRTLLEIEEYFRSGRTVSNAELKLRYAQAKTKKTSKEAVVDVEMVEVFVKN